MNQEPELSEINGDVNLPATKGDVADLARMVANTMASKESVETLQKDVTQLDQKLERGMTEIKDEMKAMKAGITRLESVAQSTLAAVQNIDQRTADHPERIERLERSVFRR